MAQLQTVGDIQAEFLLRSNRTTTDSFITDSALNGWIQEAHSWAAAFKKWPYTEGKISTTYTTSAIDDTGFVVFDYPEGWRPDTIRYLTIGGKRYQKTQFYKLQSFFEDNPQSDKKLYSDYARRLYVNSIGNPGGTVVVWGQFQVALDATDKTAFTIFSNIDDDGNDAIVEKMLSYLRRREHLTEEALANEQTATAKLEAIAKRIGEEQFEYLGVDDDGMWKRIDVLRGAQRDDTFKRDQWY